MIRHIVFDMGQVLIRWSPDHFMELLEVPREDRDQLARELYRGTEWIRLDRGTITEEETIRQVCLRLPPHLHGAVERLVSHWWEWPLEPIDGTEALIRELKEAGYGVYLLSNASLRLPEYFPRIPASRYFDGMVFSAQWKLLKPQREIFETLLREYSLRPEECFFVDDMNLNVEGALRCGMAGAVFHGDVPRLRRELAQAGVQVKL